MVTWPSDPASGPSFSVIIPTLNAGEPFDDLLEGLRAQRGVLGEIIVVDSSSEDDTRERAARHGAEVIRIPRDAFDHGAARNLGAREATGDVLLFLTQDAVPADSGLLHAFQEALLQPRVAGGYGRQLPRPGAGPVEALWRELNYPPEPRINGEEELEREGVRALFFSNSCACVRRDAFLEVGGFPERTICNEDMVMAWKLLRGGYRTAYVPGARVLHSHAYGVGDTFRRYFDTGVFFADNPALAGAARNTGEGWRQVMRGSRRLIRGGHGFHLPAFLVKMATGLLGYSAGRHHAWIPPRLRTRLSLNRGFWRVP